MTLCVATLCSVLWLTLIEEGHDSSNFIFWMDFELGQFSEVLKHKTYRKKVIFGFSAQKKSFILPKMRDETLFLLFSTVRLNVLPNKICNHIFPWL